MQAAKDSFHMALCGRLQEVNPQRTVVINGEVRPGLMVAENEAAVCAQPAEAFCIEWGEAKFLTEWAPKSRLMCADVTLRYRTSGSNHGEGDRGRALTAMDAEVLAIMTPQQTAKLDYAQATPVSLGSKIFWKAPDFGPLRQTGSLLGREAKMTVYFYPESES